MQEVGSSYQERESCLRDMASDLQDEKFWRPAAHQTWIYLALLNYTLKNG